MMVGYAPENSTASPCSLWLAIKMYVRRQRASCTSSCFVLFVLLLREIINFNNNIIIVVSSREYILIATITMLIKHDKVVDVMVIIK